MHQLPTGSHPDFFSHGTRVYWKGVGSELELSASGTVPGTLQGLSHGHLMVPSSGSKGVGHQLGSWPCQVELEQVLGLGMAPRASSMPTPARLSPTSSAPLAMG